MKKNWISILALILSIIACIITCLRVEIYTTNDTFVGVMAGFMGICATIIVCYQIFSILDTKNRLKEIERTQKELNIELAKFKNEKNKSEAVLNYTIRITQGISLHSTQPFTALGLYMMALEDALKANDEKSICKAMGFLEKSHSIINKLHLGDTDSILYTDIDVIKEKIEKGNNELKKYSLFQLIEKRFDNICNDILQSIEKINKSKP